MSDNELGLFLRTRREAVTPAQVGLPTGPRRRTPGLRRAELAMLAGVSVEYVTRLEQGRDRHPSPPVLSALADALRLSPAERIHLHRLSKSVDSGFSCMGDAQPLRDVRPTVRAILDRLEPAPAVVVNRLTEVLAYTDGYHRLMAPTGLFAGPDTPPNLARSVFCCADARTCYADWDHVADETVATLKQGPFRADPHIAALADELTVTIGPAFTDRVATVPSLAAATGITRLAHPDAGPLRLAYEVLDLSADDDQQVIVYLPADDATASALDALTGRRPGALRAVSG
ncbi:helix-turn-helix transcriptional regulator [Nocardia amamiensis]|uniref:helix-turn-helix transcriptional regulator n=1 Tax=Nocardia amamiensis TaxID=404578 RepID=UPI000831216D|nr:helix-turn-helix transcriptional regulator [Nocardia amamiensis]